MRRSPLLLCGTALAQLQLNGQGIIDPSEFAQLTIPPKTADLEAYLNAQATDYSGSHWTAFSEKYGYCAIDYLDANADPEKRHLPLTAKYACIYGDCEQGKQPFSQRYRVCTLPDHPVWDFFLFRFFDVFFVGLRLTHS